MPPGVVNFNPKAGDVVVISELLTHGAMNWLAKDRDRRFVTLRYTMQYSQSNPLPDGVLAKLSPETRELVAVQSRDGLKSIVEQDVVTLS